MIAIQRNKISKQRELGQTIDNWTNEIIRLRKQQNKLDKMFIAMPDKLDMHWLLK